MGGQSLITDVGGRCKQVPELPSPPSTWTETGSYTEGVHSLACDYGNGPDCEISYKLLCKKGYIPFGPDIAVCRKAASFWEIMPTYCVPKDFVPPKRWNINMNDISSYFNRADEWEMVAAQLTTTEATTTTTTQRPTTKKPRKTTTTTSTTTIRTTTTTTDPAPMTTESTTQTTNA